MTLLIISANYYFSFLSKQQNEASQAACTDAWKTFHQEKPTTEQNHKCDPDRNTGCIKAFERIPCPFYENMESIHYLPHQRVSCLLLVTITRLSK